MNKFLIKSAICIFSVICINQVIADYCVSKNEYDKYKKNINQDPILTIGSIEKIIDCDDKFVLLYLADKEIVGRLSNPDLLQFNNKSLLKQRKSELNEYDYFVLKNSERFKQSSEGFPADTRKFWLEKVKNINHPILIKWELESIKKYDGAVWEDGDGSAHTKKLIKLYKEYMGKYPNIEKEWILNRINKINTRTMEIQKPLNKTR